MVDVSIIAPAHNEEILIENFLMDVIDHLNKSNLTFEIIVVENGSTDSTYRKVTEIKRKTKNLTIVSLKRPSYGNALKTGIKKSVGKYVIIYNIDFYDVRLIDLCRIDMLGADLIIGSKMSHWAHDQRPLTRKIISLIFNFFLRLTLGFKGSDTHGIKLFRAEVLKKVLKKCLTNSGIADTEIVIRMQKMGSKIIDIPVSVQEIRPPRFAGRTLRTCVDIFRLLKAIWVNR